MPPVDHECDLFLLSSHRAYAATRALPEFARRGARNVHGWGIGSYVEADAHVLRSEQPALAGEDAPADLSREFAIAVEAVSSPVILGHLRLASRGTTRRKENSHPFKLNFLGYDWLLVHNGTAQDPQRLSPPHEHLLTDSDSDTPRVFEFLRRRIIEYLASPKKSLIEACRSAYATLLDTDAGTFNLILSNGHLSFVFIHWRPFYVLERTKDRGDTALVSTLRLTGNEDWQEFHARRSRKAKMLVFSGPTLVLNGDVPA